MFISEYSFSQDIDIFQKKQNDKFKFEDINPQMSIDEYRILSRDLRMKEMMYAMVVPGYVHFYAKEKKTGYELLALRLAAYGGLAYMIASDKVDISLFNNTDLDFTKDDVPTSDIIITYGSIGLIFGTYLFDWIHGQHILRKKQENIRYKYNMKMNLGLVNNMQGNPVPGVYFYLQF